MDPVRPLLVSVSSLTILGLVGCGGESEPSSPDESAAVAAAPADSGRRTTVDATPVAASPGIPASIGTVTDSESVSEDESEASAGTDTPKTAAAARDESNEPEHESVTLLRRIQALRVAPIDGDLESARAARRARNEEIIELATNVLRLTMNEPERDAQFHQGIGQLLEARFQLALTGTDEDIELLYADVQALNERDPESVAAAEGVYYLARFAHTKAGLMGKSHPVWFETLSRWAREFADRFPGQSQRAVTLLFGAARSCELHALATDDAALKQRLSTEAELCYTLLAEKFPKTDQGQDAIAVLRRMAVVGKTLSQFSGPTIDGGFVSAEDFVDKPTLIFFWDSKSDAFREELLPLLTKIREQLPPDRLRIVGVPLDEVELEFEAFVENHAVPGKQIFFPDSNQRSWDSPLLRFWGVSRIPSVWIVDRDRTVMTTDANADSLVADLQQALRR